MAPLLLLCGPSPPAISSLAARAASARTPTLALLSQESYASECAKDGAIESPSHVNWPLLLKDARAATQAGRVCLVEGHLLLADSMLLAEAVSILFLDAPTSSIAETESTHSPSARLLAQLRDEGRLWRLDASLPEPQVVDAILSVVDAAVSPPMPIGLSIGDVDSYGILFYAHYFRFCERAANLCVPGCAHAVLCRVEHMKYSSAISVAIEQEIAGEQTLLHEWVGPSKPTPLFLCLATYRLVGCPSFSLAPSADDKCARRVRALRSQAGHLFHPESRSYSHMRLSVFPDMCGARGGMSLPSILDLMERQRTELIGGQAQLEALKTSEGIMIVVYEIQQMRIHSTTVACAACARVSVPFFNG
ncbi:MAG: hypothetical protein SGPRY_001227 [Prymnesium sp.]